MGAPDKLDDLAYAMVKFCVRMAQNVTEAELERARNKLKATTLMVLDSTHAVCEGMLLNALKKPRRYEIDIACAH